MMKNKKLKKIMNDLAAGHISKKEADELIKEIKVAQIKPDKEIKGESKNNTHKRKKPIKSKQEVKK